MVEVDLCFLVFWEEEEDCNMDASGLVVLLLLLLLLVRFLDGCFLEDAFLRRTRCFLWCGE